MENRKYYTLFITEESDYHCERIVHVCEAEENSNSKDLFDLFLKERLLHLRCRSATEGEVINTNTSYVVEGITRSDSPVEFINFDELTHDPSNRLGAVA
tara:strand:+ start:2735 stop:3031 length:297 start_codon:yes stop_codon:yes gene_type:complete